MSITTSFSDSLCYSAVIAGKDTYETLAPLYADIVKAWRRVNSGLSASNSRIELVGGGDMAYISAVQGLGGLFARKKTNCVHCECATDKLGEPHSDHCSPPKRTLAGMHNAAHSPPPEWEPGQPWVPISCSFCGFQADTEEVSSSVS